jgi:hypothetical protein
MMTFMDDSQDITNGKERKIADENQQITMNHCIVTALNQNDKGSDCCASMFW